MYPPSPSDGWRRCLYSWLAVPAAALLVGLLFDSPSAAADKFSQAVKSVTATVNPTTAKRGETVTWKLTIELADGWHTYPTVQPDSKATNQVVRITFPEPGDVIFVGKVKDPPTIGKEEKDLEVKDLREAFGTVVFQRSFVVSPKAVPGQKEIVVSAKVLVCDANLCLPPKTVTAKV